MGFLNPFHELIETKKYPLARTFRTTFWGKVWDTFKVFSGNLPHFNPRSYKQVHAGVFDYLTLGLHLLLSELLLRFLEKIRSRLIFLIGVVVLLIINLPRLIFAAALTFICLPFTGIAHAFSKIKGEKLKNDILAYTVKTDECKIYLVNSITQINLEHYKNSLFFIKSTNGLYKEVSAILINLEMKS
ncbi:MAG: hypothetical protein Q8M03_15135 [Legionella sp.]|nr:hypothetical protein [Legionella sp.]